MLPSVTTGTRFVDDRGFIIAHNSFDPTKLGIRRFYSAGNHTPGFIRAWHAHKKESKWITCISGVAMVAVAQCEDPLNPDPCEPIARYILCAEQPEILHVPCGHANGWKSMTGDCVLLVMSDKTMAESMDDDYRIQWDFWDPWEATPR